MLSSSDQETLASTAHLQFDQKDVLVPKVKRMLIEPKMQQAIKESMKKHPEAERSKAKSLLACIEKFDGTMDANASGPACFALFEAAMARLTFMDELGGEHAAQWQALTAASGLSYSAQQDHLLGRENSPFWDDINTAKKEQKADIIVNSLIAAYEFGASTMGRTIKKWVWGDIHTYHWQSAATQMAPYLEPIQQKVVEWMSDYLDRGPYPAGGDKNTINVAGHTTGVNYDVWDIPAMRLIVDFSQDEPLYIINSDGQSANPASIHYDDGIPVWLKEGNRQMALKLKNRQKQYQHVLTLTPKTATQN